MDYMGCDSAYVCCIVDDGGCMTRFECTWWMLLKPIKFIVRTEDIRKTLGKRIIMVDMAMVNDDIIRTEYLLNGRRHICIENHLAYYYSILVLYWVPILYHSHYHSSSPHYRCFVPNIFPWCLTIGHKLAGYGCCCCCVVTGLSRTIVWCIFTRTYTLRCH